MDYAARAKEIMEKITYVTIATVSKNAEPWNTPVQAAFDSSYNMFWTSLAGTRHSQNIRENSRVYVSVYEPAVSGKDGVYIQAVAEEMSDSKAIETAATLLYRNKGKEARSSEEFLGSSPRRMYKAIPERCWISLDADAKIDPATSKREITL